MIITANEHDIELRKQYMQDSMPPYYDESPEVNAIMRANAQEFERKRAEAEDLLNQLFVNTASWGLGYWERVFGLSPAARSNEWRRNRLIAKIAGSETSTVRQLEELVNRFLSIESTRIDEIPHEYTFVINVPPATWFEDELFQIVEEAKPAHLNASFATLRKFDLSLNISGASSAYTQTQITPPKFEMPDLQTSIYYGALVAKYETTEIDMPPFTMADISSSRSYGGAFSCWSQTKILAEGVI